MAANDTWTSGAVGLQHGEYRDGSPLDGVHYLECKLILKPDRFTCVQDFHEYGSIVRQAAQQCEVGFSTKHVAAAEASDPRSSFPRYRRLPILQ